MTESPSQQRRPPWLWLVVIPLVLLFAAWCGFWYYGASVAERTIAGWKEREANSGRVYTCATQTVGGFPFGLEFRCADVGIAVKASQQPIAVKAKELQIFARVTQPTVLAGEFVGPMTIGEPGQAAGVTANWRKARTELQGLPMAPETASIRIEQTSFNRVPGGETLFKADSVDVTGRMVSGTVRNNPVVEVVLKLVAASSPYWHEAAAEAANVDITAELRGMKDFAPKPWPARFREIQAVGGRIEIKNARVQQRDTVAVASGTLGLSPTGGLDGQLRLTVANLDKFLPTLGLDRMLAPEAAPNKLNNALGALDRVIPGLGNVARRNAAPAISAGINLLGQSAELEGKRAVTLPLKFSDGAVSLGPLTIGHVPPLF